MGNENTIVTVIIIKWDNYSLTTIWIQSGKSNETKDIKSREMLTSYAYFIFEEISTFPQLQGNKQKSKL